MLKMVDFLFITLETYKTGGTGRTFGTGFINKTSAQTSIVRP